MSSRPLHELRFAVVDVETTGFSPRIENVIEVGVSVQQFAPGGGRELRSFSSLVGPAVVVSPFITRLTGLRQSDLATAPLFADIVTSVARCFEGVDFVVAHNVPFDRAFVEVAFTECRRDLPPLLPWIDPVPLARKHLGFAKLTRVAAHYGIAHERAHRALDDARVTAQVLYRLAAELGLTTLAELEAGRPLPSSSSSSSSSSSPSSSSSSSSSGARPSAATAAPAKARFKPFV